MHLRRTEFDLAFGDPKSALEIFDSLYASAHNVARPTDIPALALARGRALTAIGSHEETMRSLDEAMLGAEAFELAPLLWKVHVARGQAFAAAGNATSASGGFDRALAIIDRLASAIEDPAIRSTYLSRATGEVAAARQSP